MDEIIKGPRSDFNDGKHLALFKMKADRYPEQAEGRSTSGPTNGENSRTGGVLYLVKA